MSSDGDLARRLAVKADDANGAFVLSLSLEATRSPYDDLYQRRIDAVADVIRAELAPLLAVNDVAFALWSCLSWAKDHNPEGLAAADPALPIHTESLIKACRAARGQP